MREKVNGPGIIFPVVKSSRLQMESLLAELQARSPKLTLNLEDGVIYASIFEKVKFPVTQGTCVNDGAFRSCQRIAKFYELEQRMINDGYDGRYAIVTGEYCVHGRRSNSIYGKQRRFVLQKNWSFRCSIFQRV